jgi:hypothetical protein
MMQSCMSVCYAHEGCALVGTSSLRLLQCRLRLIQRIVDGQGFVVSTLPMEVLPARVPQSFLLDRLSPFSQFWNYAGRSITLVKQGRKFGYVDSHGTVGIVHHTKGLPFFEAGAAARIY